MDVALKFSLNIDFLNKQLRSDLPGYQNKFINVKGTLQELAKAINAGEAFSYQFHNEERKTANFLCTDILAIDINSGGVIPELLKNSLITVAFFIQL